MSGFALAVGIYFAGFLITVLVAPRALPHRLGSEDNFVITGLAWPVSLPVGFYTAWADRRAFRRFERGQPQPWENPTADRVWTNPDSYKLPAGQHVSLVRQEKERQCLEAHASTLVPNEGY